MWVYVDRRTCFNLPSPLVYLFSLIAALFSTFGYSSNEIDCTVFLPSFTYFFLGGSRRWGEWEFDFFALLVRI